MKNIGVDELNVCEPWCPCKCHRTGCGCNPQPDLKKVFADIDAKARQAVAAA